MPALDVPETGLSLRRDPGSDNAKPTQIMRLNLAQSTLDELIQSLRDDQTARIRLGKHQTLYYGSKSQQFHSCPESHRSEVYSGSAADKENLYFTGVLSHSLEVQKAKEATASTDQALANLEESLNAFERGKESKKTHLIDVGSLGRGRQAALLGRKAGLEKDRFLKTPSNRSGPSSPALAVSRSPASIPLTPTSAPLSQNKDRIRLDALKVPFIHLLAVRAVSVKFLAKQTRASLDDCSNLAQKYGIENRLNRDKFDLKDKTYKELDVWHFPYPSQEDRQEAIENAISAFDRMRISRSDKLWQMLLPKEERGKGKCLSRLNLQTGPIKKAATFRIQVEDTGKEEDTGVETDKAGNGLTPKTADSTSAPRSGTQKKRVPEKEAPKKAPAKAKPATATNSTLTGRVTKKAERKPVPAAKPDGKFKSAEFVHESDEDDTDMPDAPAEKPQPEKSKPAPKPAIAESKSPAASHVPTPKIGKSEHPTPKLESSQAKTASKKLPSSRVSSSNSPQKPSPLGSSPPTNASDFANRSRSSSQNNSSSSSSSPLITQLSRSNKPAPTSNAKNPPKPMTNGVVKKSTETNPLKRKAEADRPSVTPQPSARASNLEHKRRRAVSTSSGGSTGSASPPLSHELLRQQLREKSQKFKQFYAKYRTLHDSMAAHSDPPREELERLQRQHVRLQRMKKEIWDEDRRLRETL